MATSARKTSKVEPYAGYQPGDVLEEQLNTIFGHYWSRYGDINTFQDALWAKRLVDGVDGIAAGPFRIVDGEEGHFQQTKYERGQPKYPIEKALDALREALARHQITVVEIPADADEDVEPWEVTHPYQAVYYGCCFEMLAVASPELGELTIMAPFFPRSHQSDALIQAHADLVFALG